jgi:hypothetical protein
MTMSALDPFAALDAAIESAGPQERAALVAGLAARLARLAAAGMAMEPAAKWWTLDEAADQALVPAARIRKWARRAGVTWAYWPTRRSLRIDRERFEAWLREKSACTAANLRPGARDGAIGRIGSATARTIGRETVSTVARHA